MLQQQMVMRLKGQWFLMTDEIKGTMVPMTDVIKGQWFLMLLRIKRVYVPMSEANIVEGQYERSVKGAFVDAFIEVDDNKGIMVPKH